MLIHPMFAIASPEILSLFFVIFAGSILLMFVPYWVIVSKAGFSGWWCLLLFVPVANIIAPWIFAFSEWPALDRHPITPTI